MTRIAPLGEAARCVDMDGRVRKMGGGGKGTPFFMVTIHPRHPRLSQYSRISFSLFILVIPGILVIYNI